MYEFFRKVCSAPLPASLMKTEIECRLPRGHEGPHEGSDAHSEASWSEVAGRTDIHWLRPLPA